jgi:hypothetical protein
MIVQLVKFTSKLSEEEVTNVARDREQAYRDTPGLVQKFYIRFGAPDTYGGLLVWDSAGSLAAFRETELARTIPQAYGIVGAPEITVGETMFLLREDALMPA